MVLNHREGEAGVVLHLGHLEEAVVEVEEHLEDQHEDHQKVAGAAEVEGYQRVDLQEGVGEEEAAPAEHQM